MTSIASPCPRTGRVTESKWRKKLRLIKNCENIMHTPDPVSSENRSKIDIFLRNRSQKWIKNQLRSKLLACNIIVTIFKTINKSQSFMFTNNYKLKYISVSLVLYYFIRATLVCLVFFVCLCVFSEFLLMLVSHILVNGTFNRALMQNKGSVCYMTNFVSEIFYTFHIINAYFLKFKCWFLMIHTYNHSIS